MIRFLLTLLAFFTTLLVSVRALGSARNGSWFAAMLAQDANLSAHGWCWRGLCPGVTPFATARDDIQRWFADSDESVAASSVAWQQTVATEYWSGRARGTYTEQLAFVQLRPTLQTFTFGDALHQFGQPNRVNIHGYVGFGTWLVFVRFDHNIYVEMVLGEPRLKPSQPILSISFDPTGETAQPTDTYNRRNAVSAWHGFSLLP